MRFVFRISGLGFSILSPRKHAALHLGSLSICIPELSELGSPF